MNKGWYGDRMAHGLASRGIKSKMKVGFTNLGGLLGEMPSSVNDILMVRNRMLDAKERDDIDALYLEIMRIIPYMEDKDSNIEYIYNDNSMFYHPDSEEEFKRLYDQMFYFKGISDTHGLWITALQILPDKIRETGDKEDTSFFFGEAKGVKKPTKLVWSSVEELRQDYEHYPTSTLIKKADNLDALIKRNKVYPKGLNTEKKEEYIDNVNNLQAMILELDRRGIEF